MSPVFPDLTATILEKANKNKLLVKQLFIRQFVIELSPTRGE